MKRDCKADTVPAELPHVSIQIPVGELVMVCRDCQTLRLVRDFYIARNCVQQPCRFCVGVAGRLRREQKKLKQKEGA